MALIAGAWGMPAKAGDNFSLYFRSGAIYHELSIYTDNVGDNVCSFIGFFYLFQGNPNGNFYYQGFNYAPETRMVSIVPGAIPLATLTGNVIKSPNSNQLILSKDYKTLNVNGTIYYRVSKDEFDRAMRNSTALPFKPSRLPTAPACRHRLNSLFPTGTVTQSATHATERATAPAATDEATISTLMQARK